ncbi:gamma carbonic anhydrase family protein [Kineococcus sp. SYSU DK001]|uniref:gamma carbonic anhydrase family protein n=1 Tax=Kineococcus sp. SYSU DK001 TaxID=3383122 RepID=UPI003D7E813F
MTFEGAEPRRGPGGFLAPGATLVGRVDLGADVGVWYGAVLRADSGGITVGDGSNVQDGCVLHADPGFPITVGRGVSIGHGAVVHGCTVGDDVLIGMGARVLNGARIGAGSLVAAGAVVLEGTDVPPGSLVAGVPAKVRRELSAEELEGVRANARTYVDLAARHVAALDA